MSTEGVGIDTLVTRPDSIAIKLPEATTINFPLDSLLKFDSEEALKKAFDDDVKRSVGYYPEGEGEYANTMLFEGTKNEVEFVWEDDSLNFSGLTYVIIQGKGTDWKTREGITIGTSLKELEKLNQKPFTFFGFDWDYSGAVNWQDGHLFDRKIFVSLEYPGEVIPQEFDKMIGDQVIESRSVLAQKVNPVVYKITMRR